MNFDEVEWERAACRGSGPLLWFSAEEHDYQRARAVCLRCPIREDCREYGAEHEAEGTWGGVMLIRPGQRAPWANVHRYRAMANMPCSTCPATIPIGGTYRRDGEGQLYCEECRP